MRLFILHTNDFHNRLNETGVAKLREAIVALNGAPYLLLDAGDAIKAGNVDWNPFGEPILDTMSDLGYHAMTMGNREFHVWEHALRTKINRARFPVLCANIRSQKEEERRPNTQYPIPNTLLPNTLLTVGGLRVAVFGLTVPMVTERSKAKAVSSFVFDDPIKTAKRILVELRYQADILIALTHIGLTRDKELAEAVSGIDVIIGGHSHDTLTEPLVVNGTPIVQTGCHAWNYGLLTLDYDRTGVQIAYTLRELQGKPTVRAK